MAFTEVRAKLIKGMTAQVDYQGGPDENVIYLVTSDDPADTALAACTASAGGVTVPFILSPHSTTYPQLLLLNKSASRNGNTFEVSCKYGIPKFNFEQPLPEGTTTKWNKRVSVSTQGSAEECGRASDGKVVANTLGDAFKPSLTKTFYDKDIQVAFNTRTINVQALGAAIGRVNSDAVTLTITQGNFSYTFPAKTLKLTNVQYSTAVAEDRTFYWDVNLTLTYRSTTSTNGNGEIGWTQLVPNKGYRYKDGSGNTQTSATEVFLSATGTLVASGGTAHMLEFLMEDTAAFVGTGGILSGI